MRKILVLLLLIFLSGCNTSKEKDIVFSLNDGVDIISVGEPHIDTGCTIKIGEEEFDMVVSSNNINENIVGEYIISYTYIQNDKTYNYSRFVKVVDDIRPVVSLNPGIDTIKIDEVFVDSGVTYSDNYDTELNVVVRGGVNTSILGRYVITYIVTDSSSNSTEIIRIVNVVN